MRNESKVLPNPNKKLNLANFADTALRNSATDYSTNVQNFGSHIEAKRLQLILDLVGKRKAIRDTTIQRIDDLIVYCDNKILSLGNEYQIRADQELRKFAQKWQQMILDLEKQKISENKELFRDTLFLRNEWIKSLLSYTEEKQLDKLLVEIMGDPKSK